MKQQEKEKEYETYVKEKTGQEARTCDGKSIRDRRDHLYDWTDDLKCVRKGGNVKGYFCKLVFTDPDPGKCGADRIWNLSKDRELGRSGSTGANHRICQFRCGAGN